MSILLFYTRLKMQGRFLFKLRNPETTVKDMSESVMREVVGQRELEFLLTGGRQEVEQVVRSDLQDILDEYESGVLSSIYSAAKC